MCGLDYRAIPDQLQHRLREVLEPPPDEIGQAFARVLAAGLENVLDADGLPESFAFQTSEHEASNHPTFRDFQRTGGDAGGVSHLCGNGGRGWGLDRWLGSEPHRLGDSPVNLGLRPLDLPGLTGDKANRLAPKISPFPFSTTDLHAPFRSSLCTGDLQRGGGADDGVRSAVYEGVSGRDKL